MSLDSALYTVLTGELAAYVSEPLRQVSPKPVRGDAPFPHVRFRVLDDPERFDHPDHWARLRVHVRHSDFHQAKEVAGAVHDALNNLQDTVDGFAIDHIQCIDRGQDPELDMESRTWETYSDYRLCFH